MPKKPPTAHEQRQAARVERRKTRQDRYAAEARAARSRHEAAHQAATKPRQGSAKQRYRDRLATARGTTGQPSRSARRVSTAQRRAIAAMLLARELLELAQRRLARCKALGLGSSRQAREKVRE
jgi:hypothetical protein